MLFKQASIKILPDNLQWRIIPVEPGDMVEGWYAGPMVLVDVHWINKRSLPCRRAITDGKLPCPCEREPKSIRTIGYVPILGKQRERWVVIVSESVAAKMEAVKCGSPIRLSRPKKPKRPLFLSMIEDGALGIENTKKMRAGAACHDISEFLLHVWQDRELTEHLGARYIPATAGPWEMRCDQAA
jgi:hypothetical protein